MFIDASALVAILLRESGFKEIVEQIDAAPKPVAVSPLVRLEATLALARTMSSSAVANRPLAKSMVIANAAASARIAPAIKARINVSRVDIKIFDSPASIILVTNSEGTK